MTPKKKLNMLLADDGSQHAQAAVELLQNIPIPTNSRIWILRAFNSGQIPLIGEFEASLARSKSQLTGRGFHVDTELKLGSAAEMILEKAEAHKQDLIVLGAKGLRSTVSILLGGVAQQVLEYATCPVLIVRAPYRGFQKILLVTDGSPFSLSAARYLGPSLSSSRHFFKAAKAGLYLVDFTTNNFLPLSFAVSIILTPSEETIHNGFSQRTWDPARRAFTECSACSPLGVQTAITSIPGSFFKRSSAE